MDVVEHEARVEECIRLQDIAQRIPAGVSKNTTKAAVCRILGIDDPWVEPHARRDFFESVARLAVQARVDYRAALAQARRGSRRFFGGRDRRPKSPADDVRVWLDNALRGHHDPTTTLVLCTGFCALSGEELDPRVELAKCALDEPRLVAIRQGRDWGLAYGGCGQAVARLRADTLSEDSASWTPYQRGAGFFGLFSLSWWGKVDAPDRQLIEAFARSDPMLLDAMLRGLSYWHDIAHA